MAEAEGEESAAVLVLAPGQLSLQRERCELYGPWRASREGLFVGQVDGWSSGCDPDHVSAPRWLDLAVGFRIEPSVRVLLDRRGSVVARLFPGGRPEVEPGDDPTGPVVTEEIRATFGPAAPLPDGVQAAGPAELVGRWVPTVDTSESQHPTPPYAELAAEGSWHGSDGCNGQSGRWAAGADGAVLFVAGPQTLMFCDNVDIAGMLTEAARAGIDGDVVTFYDRSGIEVGQLRRST